MHIDDKVQRLIDKVTSTNLEFAKDALSDGDFGVYIPTYLDNGRVKLMSPGQSQNETDLEITITSDPSNIPENAQPVGWFGSPHAKDKTCTHPGGRNCTHCTSHTGPTQNCTGHPKTPGDDHYQDDVSFPVLDYDNAMNELETKRGMLEVLANKGFGMALLHGHSPQHKFTKLPTGYVSVISNGKTWFRTVDEVKADESFVPNTWRFTNGELQVAGGFSTK